MRLNEPGYKTWDAHLVDDGTWTPMWLNQLYSSGFQGAFDDPHDRHAFDAWARYSDYGEVCDDYDLWTTGPRGATSQIEPGLYLPFMGVVICEAARLGITGTPAELSRDERIAPWDEAQTTGDCVSHGTRNQCDALRACEIVYQGEPEQWIVRTATEPIYGHRGHGGQGADPGRLRRWVCDTGGMMLRQVYELPEFGRLDLSRYNASIGIQWGGRGVPQSVTAEAAKHPIRDITRITTTDQLRQAFRNGLCVGGGSMMGISSQRDQYGVSRSSGSWAHDMTELGYDERQAVVDIYGEALVLVQNSWAAWNRGPRQIYGTQIWIPIGSCWMRESDWVRRKLSGGSVYVMAGAEGWEQTTLLDYGVDWLSKWGW